MEKKADQDAILNMLNEEIEALPKEHDSFLARLLNRFNPTLAMISTPAATDIMQISFNILSFIASVVTIGEITFKVWRRKKQSMIKRFIEELQGTNIICNEKDAERIILKVVKMMNIKIVQEVEEVNKGEKQIT